MGGTQSWLSCDGTYPTPDPANSASADKNEANGGDPIIAVIMFLTTLFGLLLLTALGHCGIIALRGLRHRRAHRRHQRMLQPQPRQLHEVDSGAVGEHQLAAPTVTVVPHPASDADGDGGVDDGETSSTSSMSSSSSESSLDSTTARIAAQVASRRRQSRLMMLDDPSEPSARPTDAGFGGSGVFLVPPPPPYAPDTHRGYENRGYNSRFDP